MKITMSVSNFHQKGMLCLFVLIQCSLIIHFSFAFPSSALRSSSCRSLQLETIRRNTRTFIRHNSFNTQLYGSSSSAGNDQEDDISRQLRKAKELLAQAKSKIEAETKLPKDDNTNGEKAKEATTPSDAKRQKVTKSKNDDTGLITTNGELMAALSEIEEWEARSLDDVFEEENEKEESSLTRLAERDLQASIFNLRMSLKNDDYQKIFDSRNRFIGEDN